MRPLPPAFRLPMRKLLILAFLIAIPLSADETAYLALQSGWLGFATPVFDHGIHGEGQIVAVLDTGVDWTSCYFAEADGSKPPLNTGSPRAGLAWQNIDRSRRTGIQACVLFWCPMVHWGDGHGCAFHDS